MGLESHDRPLSSERVCSVNSVDNGDCGLHATLCPGGGIPSFHHFEERIFPDTRSSVVEEATEVPVLGGGGGLVYQFKTLCFGLSTALQIFTRVFAVVSAWVNSPWGLSSPVPG